MRQRPLHDPRRAAARLPLPLLALPPRDEKNASFWQRIDHPPPDALQPPRAWYTPLATLKGAPGPFLPAAAPGQGKPILIQRAEIRIGDSLVIVSSTLDRGDFPAFLYIYVDDADRVYEELMQAYLAVRDVDHVHEKIGDNYLFERGLKRLDEAVREAADKADGIGDEELLVAA